MKRVFLIGCSAIFVLAIIVVALGVAFGPKLVNRGVSMFKAAMTESARIQDLANNWTPPGSTLDAAWIPPQVGDWRAVTPQTPVPGLPRLDIDRAGTGGVYEWHGQKMEVNVVPANRLEKEALTEHVKTALSKGDGTRSSQSFGDRYTFENGPDKTCLWWIKGWLLIFQSSGEGNPAEFAEVWLANTGDPKTTAPAETPSDKSDSPPPAETQK